jgi:hypothetical protein
MVRPLVRALAVVPGFAFLGAAHAALLPAQNVTIPCSGCPTLELHVAQTTMQEPAGATSTHAVTFDFRSADVADAFTPQVPLTMTFTFRGRSATEGTCGAAGADYQPGATTLVFTGQVSQTSTFVTCGDELSEGDETIVFQDVVGQTDARVFVQLVPERREPGTAKPMLTIRDADPLPVFAVTPEVRVSEPATGQSSAVFTVSLTGLPTQRAASVEYLTTAGTATAGGACARRGAGPDYVTTTGKVTFEPVTGPQRQYPTRRREVTVPVCGDAVRIEPDETFFLGLARPVNAVLPKGVTSPNLTTSPTLQVTKGTGTIVNRR